MGAVAEAIIIVMLCMACLYGFYAIATQQRQNDEPPSYKPPRRKIEPGNEELDDNHNG